MAGGRVELLVAQLLDEAQLAFVEERWAVVQDRARKVLLLDPESADARALLAAAERALDSSGPSIAAVVQEPSESAQPAPESFAGGRYVVRRFLGEGGKKRVFLAYDSLLDREVAFALIKSEGLDEVGRERVRREAQAMGRLGAHPHIVSVFDLGEEAGAPFVVTELMGGGDVEGLIEEADQGRLPIERAVEIAGETAQGLEFAHAQGIVHRDLKPGNVWLTGDGRAKIGDFGLAVAVDRTRLTQAGMMVGTVSYMPPEQATGGEVGPRSDLYSLGAMLYEMVCGRPPFVGDEQVAVIGQHLNTAPVAPSWHRPDCPHALEALICSCSRKIRRRGPSRQRTCARHSST
jgi:serine/threonine protein kinase